MRITSTRNVNDTNYTGRVTFYTDDHATPLNVAGPGGTAAVTVDGGTGTNTIQGLALANSWALTGANSGSLDGWVSYVNFANLAGGPVSDSFDFSPGGSVSGDIAGTGGNDLLDYARLATPVYVDLATGAATGVGGLATGIQGAVGGSGTNTLIGNGTSMLIAGAGASTLVGGSGNSLLIAGTTSFDFNDLALEAILDEWERTDIPLTSIESDLQYGGGLNGAYELHSGTVAGNGQPNTVDPGSGPN